MYVSKNGSEPGDTRFVFARTIGWNSAGIYLELEPRSLLPARRRPLEACSKILWPLAPLAPLLSALGTIFSGSVATAKREKVVYTLRLTTTQTTTGSTHECGLRKETLARFRYCVIVRIPLCFLLFSEPWRPNEAKNQGRFKLAAHDGGCLEIFSRHTDVERT